MHRQEPWSKQRQDVQMISTPYRLEMKSIFVVAGSWDAYINSMIQWCLVCVTCGTHLSNCGICNVGFVYIKSEIVAVKHYEIAAAVSQPYALEYLSSHNCIHLIFIYWCLSALCTFSYPDGFCFWSIIKNASGP